LIITGISDKNAIYSYPYYKNIVESFRINDRIYVAKYNNDIYILQYLFFMGK